MLPPRQGHSGLSLAEMETIEVRPSYVGSSTRGKTSARQVVSSMMCDCPKGKRGEMCPDKAKVMRMHYPEALGAAMGIRRRCDRPTVGAAGAGAGSVAAGAGEGSMAAGGGAGGAPAVTPPALPRAAAGP